MGDAHQIIGFSNNREDNDFYKSPSHIIDDLLNKIEIKGSVWENACGDGVLSKRLKELNYEVYSSDLINRGYGEINNFLLNNKLYKVDNIITNPPYKYAKEFILKSLEVVNGKVCMLLKIQFLETKNRYDDLFILNKLEKVLVYSKRLSIGKGGNEYKSGMMTFAWFIFDNNNNNKPIIDWIY